VSKCSVLFLNPVIDNGPGGYGLNGLVMIIKFFPHYTTIQKGAPQHYFSRYQRSFEYKWKQPKYYKVGDGKSGKVGATKIILKGGHGFFSIIRIFKAYKKDRFPGGGPVFVKNSGI